jgi:hypothetical protein
VAGLAGGPFGKRMQFDRQQITNPALERSDE